MSGSWPIGLGVTLALMAVVVTMRALGGGPGRPFSVSLRQFWLILAAITVVYWGGVLLLHP